MMGKLIKKGIEYNRETWGKEGRNISCSPLQEMGVAPSMAVPMSGLTLCELEEARCSLWRWIWWVLEQEGVSQARSERSQAL